MKTWKLSVLSAAAAFSAMGSSSFAGTDPSIGKIEHMYSVSGAPSRKSLTAIWVGRCFTNSESEAPIEGAMLIGNDPRAVGGPLFGGEDQVNFRVAFGSPAEFDTFLPDEDPLPSSRETYGELPAKEVDGSMRLQAGKWGAWSSIWNVRIHEKSRTLYALQHSARSEAADATPLHLMRACYFFKRVR